MKTVSTLRLNLLRLFYFVLVIGIGLGIERNLDLAYLYLVDRWFGHIMTMKGTSGRPFDLSPIRIAIAA